MIRSARSLMITTCLSFAFTLTPGASPWAAAQTNECALKERYTEASEHCTGANPADIIALGVVSVETGANGTKRVILRDQKLGGIELLLTPSLVQTIDEYPADTFEAEGSLTNGQMTVKSLRPIE